jgi:hypothetical protein
MSRLISRRRVMAATTAAIVASVTVTAFASASSTSSSGSGQLAPSVGKVPLIQGTASGVLTALAARLPLVSNPQTVSETVPAAPDPGSPGSAVSGLKVVCDLAVDSIGGSALTKALWERDLFMGAVRDEFAARGLGDVIDGDATFVTPDGTRVDAGGGVSNGVVTDQTFNAIPSNAASALANRAAHIGLGSIKTHTMQVLQNALVIHATSKSPTADVGSFLQKGGLQFLLGESPMDFEGVYLEIDNSSGNPVYITDTAPRDGGGGWWADPSLGIQGFLTSPQTTTG